MEEIREAVERAKASNLSPAEQRVRQWRDWSPSAESSRAPPTDAPLQKFELHEAQLRSKRIIADDHAAGRSAPFDMLRTQVLQSMDVKDWKFLGVTSPTPGCGKTVTAINLALSIARQPERSVLLVDLDLRKPNIASCLGLRPVEDLVSVLENRSRLPNAMIEAHIGVHRMMVLPTKSPTAGSSDRMASRAMSNMLRQIRTDYPSHIVILDLAPVLSSDDVLAILPQVDCMLLVTALGTSTVPEIEECNKHLHSVDIVRVVLNKVPPSNSSYYYY